MPLRLPCAAVLGFAWNRLDACHNPVLRSQSRGESSATARRAHAWLGTVLGTVLGTKANAPISFALFCLLCSCRLLEAARAARPAPWRGCIVNRGKLRYRCNEMKYAWWTPSPTARPTARPPLLKSASLVAVNKMLPAGGCWPGTPRARPLAPLARPRGRPSD